VSNSIAAQYAQIFRSRFGRATPVVLRHITRSSGPIPYLNPPTLVDPVLSADLAAGGIIVNLNATIASGQFMPGDVLVIDGTALTVAANAPARTGVTPGFDGIALAAPAPLAVAAGTPVTASFAADQAISAVINGFSLQAINGSSIEQNDLLIRVANYPIAITPEIGDLIILPSGQAVGVVNRTPSYVGASVVAWTIQAR
jgi:hypothetical protein